MNATMNFRSNFTFPWLDLRHPVYSKDMTSSIILIVLYVPVFLVSIAGNITSVAILARFCSKTNLLKNLFLINLFIADFSGRKYALLPVIQRLQQARKSLRKYVHAIYCDISRLKKMIIFR